MVLPVIVVVVISSVGFAGTILVPRRTRGPYPAFTAANASIETTGSERIADKQRGADEKPASERAGSALSSSDKERARRFGLGSLVASDLS
jgi:hypothetical protein